MSQLPRTDKFQRLQVAILKINNKTYPIYEGINTIGRQKEAIVNIKHLNISQNHAIIGIINGNHFISDLNSSNGTFLENQKVAPFKLSTLKHNDIIKLGDLRGTYISQGPFSSSEENHFELTQDFTQSFYGSNTQMLDNLKINDTANEVEDIHDAPTQEITWSDFKIPRNVKTVEKNINQAITNETDNIKPIRNEDSLEEDIHTCETQVIGDPFIPKQKDQCEKQTFHDKKTACEQNSSSEIGTIKDNSQIHSLNNVDEDIQDAETQVLPLTSKKYDGISNPILPESELFGPFNDEELPIFQDNDNYMEIHKIPEVDKTLDIHEVVTQVMDISKKCTSPILNSKLRGDDDDEATDCEDNINEVGVTKTTSEDLKKKHSQNASQDQVTDCEDSTQDDQVNPSLVQDNKTNFVASDDDSNDSMEFFKLDRSINKESKEPVNKTVVAASDVSGTVTKENNDNGKKKSLGQSISNVQTENSSEEKIRFKKKKVCHLSSGSETDDEEIGYKRKNKSSMIISTEDIREQESESKTSTVETGLNHSKKLRNRDSYVINDTDSESEMEPASKQCLEESIPATQATDLDDTDCIPATQELPATIERGSNKISGNTRDSANGSSEESFKLGLTELMTNPSQTTNNQSSQEPCCSKSLKNSYPILSEPSCKINKEVNNIQSDDTEKTDIYDAGNLDNKIPDNIENDQGDFSEKVQPEEENLVLNFNDTEYPYEISTQNDATEMKDHVDGYANLDETNNAIYSAPTQKVSNKEPTHKIDFRKTKPASQLDEINDEIYFQPTQKVVHLSDNIYDAPTQKTDLTRTKGAEKKKQLDATNDEIYFQPTQKVSHKVYDNIYDEPTQKTDFTRTKEVEKKKQLDVTNDEIYFQPTQKVVHEIYDNIYDAPTQQTDFTRTKEVEKKKLNATNDEIYFQATQKVSSKLPDMNQNSSREESMDELYLQPTQQLDDIFDQPTQKVNKPNQEIENDGDDKYGLAKPNAVVGESEKVSSQSKKKFSFKKKASILDGSLTNLLDHNPPQIHLQREDRSSIELEFVPSLKSFAETSNRPSNPLSHILENAGELDDPVNPQPKEQHAVITDENSLGKVISLNQEETEKISLAKSKDEKVKNTNKDQVDREVASKLDTKEEETSTTLGISSKDKIFVNLKEPTRSLRIKERSTCSGESENRKNKTNMDISEPKTANNGKNENIQDKLDIKPIGRRHIRRLSSLESKSSDLEIAEKKFPVNPDMSDNSLNATRSEVNQSMAILEAKITKTRKTRKSAKVQVKVPKTRKSMTISEIDDVPEPPVNINNNRRSKFDQESNDKRIPIVSISRSNITSNKKYKNTRQSAERDIPGKSASKSLKGDKDNDSATINTNFERPKRNNLKMEMLKEHVTTVSNEKLDDLNKASTSKMPVPIASKTRQVGKRKQFAEVKSDTSDTSIQSVDSNLNTPKKPKMQPNRQVGKKSSAEISDNTDSSLQSVDSNLVTPNKKPSRQIGKRKQPLEAKSDNSDSSLQSVDSNLVTPKKQKLQPIEALLNTKERGLRKQRPKVVFTMLESPQMESMIKQLGGSVIDSVDACTVLLTEHVKRSQKLLSAVGLGKPICSPKWITDSKKAHEFSDPWDYILADPEAEKKWDFSLKESLNRSRTEKLLNSYNFQIMVTNAADVLKGAIESCGGKCISRIPSQPLDNTFIISIPENKSKYKRVTKQHPNIKVIEPEAIFDGVLRQELRFDKHYLI